MKFCSWQLGHMTKMAAKLIYSNNPVNIYFSVTGRPISTELGLYSGEKLISPNWVSWRNFAAICEFMYSVEKLNSPNFAFRGEISRQFHCENSRRNRVDK